MLVDTLGCLLAVLVLAADVADRDGAELLLELYVSSIPGWSTFGLMAATPGNS